MARERDIKLDEYEISKWAVRELKAFCRQYPEKKEKLKSLYDINAISYEQSGGRSTAISDPTLKKAFLASKLSFDCELIEQTAIEAAGELYPYLLKNVTEGVGYYNLDTPSDNRPKFYKARRKFFYLLYLRRNMA